MQAAGLKIPGKLACRTHQFGIGPAPASVLDRHQVWAFRRPGRHLIGDSYLGRRIQFYPRVGKQVPGLIRHQRVGIDTPVGVLHNLLEQCRKLTPHLHNPLLGKQVGVGNQAQSQPALPFSEVGREIKLGLGCFSGFSRALCANIRQRQLTLFRNASIEQDLEHGRPAQILLRPQLFDEPLERYLLVVVGAQSRRTNPAEKLGKGRAARQVAAQDHRVDEKPD